MKKINITTQNIEKIIADILNRNEYHRLAGKQFGE